MLILQNHCQLSKLKSRFLCVPVLNERANPPAMLGRIVQQRRCRMYNKASYVTIVKVSQANTKENRRRFNVDSSSLSHTRYKCQYHIVFIPKYRKRIMYGRLKADVREIIKNCAITETQKQQKAQYVQIMYICV